MRRPQQPIAQASTVNVFPTSETIRRDLFHPSAGGIGFGNNPDGTPWPDDQFTARRLRDGDISLEPTNLAPLPPVPVSKPPGENGDESAS